jgi:hypothetical protein
VEEFTEHVSFLTWKATPFKLLECYTETCWNKCIFNFRAVGVEIRVSDWDERRNSSNASVL